MAADGTVLSVRLSEQELARLKNAAGREGSRMSDFIRVALDSYASSRREPIVQIEAPEGSRVYVYRGGPPLSYSAAHGSTTMTKGGSAGTSLGVNSEPA